jgi:hypothetical protein
MCWIQLAQDKFCEYDDDTSGFIKAKYSVKHAVYVNNI